MITEALGAGGFVMEARHDRAPRGEVEGEAAAGRPIVADRQPGGPGRGVGQ